MNCFLFEFQFFKKRPCWKYLFIYLFYYDRNQSVPGKNELCSIFLGESAKAMISGSSLKKGESHIKCFHGD